MLGAVAAALGIWWLGRAYDVDGSRLLGFLAASLLFVTVLILLAFGGAALVRALRRANRPLPRTRPNPADAAKTDR